MKMLRLLPAALLLTVSAWASASPSPIVKVDSIGEISPVLDSDKYSFGIQDIAGLNETGIYSAKLDLLSPTDGGDESTDLFGILFGVAKKADHGFGWSWIHTHFGAGSFTFRADPGSYKAFVTGISLPGQAVSYHFQVAQVSPIPEPESWAMMLLGVGFIVYQVRRRQQPGKWRPFSVAPRG